MARRPSTTAKSTPLRDWRAKNPDVSWEDLARDTGLSTSTVKRAAAGEPIDEASAASLAKRTGIDAAAFGATSRPKSAPIGDRDPKPEKSKHTTKVESPHAKYKDARSRAAILVYAELKGDERAATLFDVSERTVRRWRADLPIDADLARAYVRRLEAGWSRKLMALVEELCDAALGLIRAGKVADLREVAALLETAAGLLVQREALTRRMGEDDDDGEGESQAHRDGAAAGPDRPGARDVTTH
jgi:transposase